MSEMHTIEEWKDKKTVQPKGECICAGCVTHLRKRKYNTTWYDHLPDVEQPSKYCKVCLRAGHDMVFPRSHTDDIRDGKGKIIKGGKRLPMTDRQRKEGETIQRGMHG